MENKNSSVGLRLLLISCVVLGVLQLFLLKIGDFYIPLYLMLVYGMGVYYSLGLNDRRKLPGGRAFALYIAAISSSLFWSVDVKLGVRDIIYTVSFIIVFSVAFNFGARREKEFLKIFKIFIILATAHSLVVIIFRLFPEVEGSFLSSSIASYFINPNSISSYSALLNNNVRDQFKSGGFFLNANTGAVFSEIALFGSVALAIYFKKILWTFCSFVSLIAIFSSGSKSAIILTFVSPLLVLVINNLRPSKSSLVRRVSMLSMVISMLGLGYFIYFQYVDSLFDDGAEKALMQRQVFLDYAISAFRNSPMLGQGYGGWFYDFAPFGYYWRDIGVSEDMPAHNSLIIIWSQSGLLAVIFSLLFYFQVFRYFFFEGKNANFDSVRLSVASALVAMFLHSLGDNFGLFPELRIQVAIAMLLAWACIMNEKTEK